MKSSRSHVICMLYAACKGDGDGLAALSNLSAGQRGKGQVAREGSGGQDVGVLNAACKGDGLAALCNPSTGRQGEGKEIKK